MSNGFHSYAVERLVWGGQPVSEARLAVILVHGRGSTAEDMLALAESFGVNDVAYAAPQAPGNTWYPYSFLAPIERNEPGITSGMQALSAIIDQLELRDIPVQRVGLVGFSQGACLALEYAARHARRYAAVAGLSGGLIGPPGTPRTYAGSLEGTPVFLGCSDVDPHVPLDRVLESAEVFRQMEAVVDRRIYPNMGHTVNRDELRAVHTLLTTGHSPRIEV